MAVVIADAVLPALLVRGYLPDVLSIRVSGRGTDAIAG
jgi:hypothetical protein